MSRGLYIHIPFCLRKCPYCDFPSEPLPERALVHRYLRALAVEARLPGGRRKGNLRHALHRRRDTVTSGRGRALSPLPFAVGESFSLEHGAEVTIEANPATVEAERAQRFLELGVNRISLGVQSFQDRALRRWGEFTVPKIPEAAFHFSVRPVSETSASTSSTVSPARPRETGDEDLDAALDIRPEHLSLYSLTVEEGTGFATRREPRGL